MLFSELPYPTIFGHRGASAYAPENTLASFQLALRQNADAVELDAKLTSDGQVIVIHDQTVDRTTDHTGRVRELPLAEFRQMDGGSHFDVAFRGEPVPTLEDVFQAVGQLTYINVELTNYASVLDELPEKVAELVNRYHLNQRVLFSSFNPIALHRIPRLVPDAPIGLLAGRGASGALARSFLSKVLPLNSLHPEKSDVTPRLVQNAHKRGQKVFVYTVNRQEDMIKLFQMGVDGIFTDDPVLARQVVQSMDH